MAADTKGSNGFDRLQTFEQKLLATAYEFLGFLEILGFLLMLQVKFCGVCGCRNRWLQKPMEVMGSTDFTLSNKIYWPGPLEFVDLFLGFTCNYENTVVAGTNGSNGFYRLQTFEQNLLARAYGILGFLLRLQITF